MANDKQVFEGRAATAPQWQWYAIADSARFPQLPAALMAPGAVVRCLLGAKQNTPLAQQSPHLVQLSHPARAGLAWQWIDAHPGLCHGVMIIASAKAFDDVFAQLSKFVDITLPDGDTMFFAFWDPAILGTLIGQADDHTLHVAGPVFDDIQTAKFFEGIGSWWYWDRAERLHECVIPPNVSDQISYPVALTQFQVDELVEASVPDHVIYFLNLNQPLLLARVAAPGRYAFVSQQIKEARAIGLEGMRDIVNYVCAVLIYGDQLVTDARLREILLSVKMGEMNFTEALAKFP